MARWTVERVVHFGPGDFVKSGLAHFGFHLRDGRYYAIAHAQHYLALVGRDDRLEWTAAAQQVFEGVPNIAADLEFPIYVDVLPDGTLVVSNFGNAKLYRIDPESMSAQVLVDGHARGLGDMGNCVVDDQGSIWVNEVRGCRIWRFDPEGQTVQTLGDGTADVGDRFNHVVRVIDRESGTISTIAGRPDASAEAPNDPGERDPMRLNLPMISSLDYDRDRLFVPTDLAGDSGDLAVLRRA